jgi:hypothetical protein
MYGSSKLPIDTDLIIERKKKMEIVIDNETMSFNFGDFPIKTVIII